MLFKFSNSAKLKFLALSSLFCLLLSVFVLPAFADYSGRGSLAIADPSLDFRAKEFQEATLTIATDQDFNPDLSCIYVNHPLLNTTDKPTLGQFCYTEARGFFAGGDSFWQGGAVLDKVGSLVTKTETTLTLKFRWNYSQIRGLRTETLSANQVSALFYETKTGKSGKVVNTTSQFAITNLPPFINKVTVLTPAVSVGGTLSFETELKTANPASLDRVLVGLNYQEPTPLGLVEWREGKGFFLSGSKTTNGNQYLEAVSGVRTVLGSTVKFRFDVKYNNNLPVVDPVFIKLYYQADAYTEAGVADSNTADNFSSGWINSQKSFLTTTAQVTPPVEEPTANSPMTLAEYCDLTIVDLNCNNFAQASSRTTAMPGGKMIFVTPPAPTETVVKGDGSEANPFNSLQAANNAANAGDVVKVAPGSYLDCLSYSDCYELTFDQSDVVWLANGAVLKPSGRNSRGLTLAASNIEVVGLEINNFTGTGVVATWAATEAAAPKGQVLKDVKIVVNPNTTSFGDGIGMYGFHNGLTLLNVTIENGFQGVTCAEVCNNLYFDGLVINNKNYGSGSSGADAIGIEDGNNAIMANVSVLYAEADGIDVKGDNTLVINSSVTGAKRNGIKLWGNGDIVGSVVSNTGADGGIIFNGGSNYRMANSMLTNHLATGYIMTVNYGLSVPVNVEIVNSIFYNNPKGIYFPTSATLTLKNNLFKPGTSNGKVFEQGGLVVSTLADLTSASAITQSGNLDFGVNPLFVTPLSGDFSLSALSPLVNAGLNYGNLPRLDQAGQLRIQGGQVDIGPMEL
jgi:hypothetical protein